MKQTTSDKKILAGSSSPAFPKIVNHDPDPDYLRSLIAKSFKSQRDCARCLGVSYSTMRDYLNSEHPSKAPYAVQLGLENLSQCYNGYFVDFDRELKNACGVEACLDGLANIEDKDYGAHLDHYRIFLQFNSPIHIDELYLIVDSLDLGEYRVRPMSIAGTIRLG